MDGSFFSLASGQTGLADIIFPRLWLHHSALEVFWFHPVESDT